MAQASAFDRHFSRAEQHKIAAWLDENPAMSVDDFHALLAERGLAVGRSTAHREKRRLEKMGERLRRSQDLMESIGETLSGKSDTARMRAMVEATRTLVFELQEAMLDREEVEADAQEMMFLTSAVERVIKAARQIQQFGEAERRELLQATSERVDAVARNAGLSPDTAAAIRAAIEGAA